MPAAASPPPRLRDQPWRRLNARMLLVHPVHETVRFLPALLVVFVTGRNNQRNPLWDVVAVVVVVAVGLSRWFTTRYRIHGGQVELQRGLLRREVIATPAERVRTVDVTASVWHRALGLAKVEIGTAGGQGTERLTLDALTAAEAASLRGELLHRAAGSAAGGAGAADPERASPSVDPASRPASDDAPPSAATASWLPEAAGSETVLLRLHPAWVRYAPLTTSGLLSAAAVFGFASQFLFDALVDEPQRLGGAIERAQALGAGLLILVLAVAALAFVSLLAVTGYLLSYWDFRLTRHPGGTLHVSRGLLTTRATSIEESRMRGVEVGEPLGLRLAGAARLSAVTTGLRRSDQGSGSAWLSPPAARDAVEAAAAAVVGDRPALTGELHRHGPRARRRRYVRAVAAGLLLAGLPAGLGVWWHWPVAAVGTLLVLCAASVPLAQDRYAGLGHLLTERHLVSRSGSLARRRDVLARHGVIGVVLSQSFFQRRAGLVTLTATTAAGRQGYHVPDVPAGSAVGLSLSLLPETVEQFLV